jgi:hypothetical protein
MKKKIVLLLISIAILAVIAGGIFLYIKYFPNKTTPNSEQPATNTNNYKIVPFEELAMPTILEDDFDYIINSKEEYEDLQKLGIFDTEDGKSKITEIDFNKKTLLGKFAKGYGCQTEFKKSVLQDEENKKIIYTIEPITAGFCDKRNISLNWILIPKVSEDYEVSFEVKIKK